MKIQRNSKLVMIGDSITDCGRARPVGEGPGEALGRGYVGLIDSWLQISPAQPNIRVVNMGTSGDTARDLKRRWQTDVLDLKPDWLALMIGVNDVWRQFDSPNQIELHVGLDEYRHTLETLVQQTAPSLRGLILLTPFLVEPNPAEPMRAQIDQYGAVVRTLARQSGAVLVDTQAAFDQVLQAVHPARLAADRVHPTPAGHMLLAKAFLQAVEMLI
jgi:lysophospholipase L1-like esterase